MSDTRGMEHTDGAPPREAAESGAVSLAGIAPRRFGTNELLSHPAVAWVVLVCGIIATGLCWAAAHDMAARRVNDHFLFLTNEVVTAIERRMADYVFALRAGTGLFEWSDEVTRAEWMGFHRTLEIEKAFPGIEGYAYVRVVPASEVSALETLMRREGVPQFTVHPGSYADERAVVTYIAPFSGRNPRASGYDMYTDPVRRAAMERARDTGEPALSGKVTLVQESGPNHQNGVVMYLPVYRAGMPIATTDDRRAALRGYVAGAFRMGDLMRGVLNGGMSGVRFEIFDGRVMTPETSLVRQGVDGSDRVSGDAAIGTDRVIEVAGRPWTLRMAPEAGFADAVDDHLPLAVALGGGVLNLTLFALVREITRRHKRVLALAREMTRDLNAARAAAERASVAKSAFLTRMSHELRTPLNAILGFSNMMLEGALGPVRPERYRGYVERIHAGGAHLLSLVSQLLDLSAIEAGRHQLHPEGIDLDESLEEVAELVRPLAERGGIALRVRLAPDTPPVWADRRALNQVMVNLIGNGVKFTPAGGSVTVRARPADDAAGVVISVTDTGRGIAAGDLERVLEPFVTTAGADGVEGTGLGLPISKALVDAHGGAFGVESVVGEGTTVTFTLPAMAPG